VSTWRRKAIELFPDLASEFQTPQTTIYGVFTELRARCQQAHIDGNEGELRKIYGFAAWCASQKEKDLWNAAGVSFYEHLADSPNTLADLTKWVSRATFEDIAQLLEMRLGVDKVEQLRRRYRHDR